jgi:hypothetical protein
MLDARHFTRSKYLASADIGDQLQTAVIRATRAEEVGREKENKLVLYLSSAGGQHWPRGIVLNQTNINTLRDAYGDDAARWAGNPVEIYTEATHLAGKPTRGIRVRPAANGDAADIARRNTGPSWDPADPDDLSDPTPF